MKLHRQRVFTSGDWYVGRAPVRIRILGRLKRVRWPWSECEWAGLGRRCPYYDCAVHGEANRAPLAAEKARRDAEWLEVLDRTDGATSEVLTRDLLDRHFALMYFGGDPRQKAARSLSR